MSGLGPTPPYGNALAESIARNIAFNMAQWAQSQSATSGLASTQDRHLVEAVAAAASAAAAAAATAVIAAAGEAVQAKIHEKAAQGFLPFLVHPLSELVPHPLMPKPNPLGMPQQLQRQQHAQQLQQAQMPLQHPAPTGIMPFSQDDMAVLAGQGAWAMAANAGAADANALRLVEGGMAPGAAQAAGLPARMPPSNMNLSGMLDSLGLAETMYGTTPTPPPVMVAAYEHPNQQSVAAVVKDAKAPGPAPNRAGHDAGTATGTGTGTHTNGTGTGNSMTEQQGSFGAGRNPTSGGGQYRSSTSMPFNLGSSMASNHHSRGRSAQAFLEPPMPSDSDHVRIQEFINASDGNFLQPQVQAAQTTDAAQEQSAGGKGSGGGSNQQQQQGQQHQSASPPQQGSQDTPAGGQGNSQTGGGAYPWLHGACYLLMTGQSS